MQYTGQQTTNSLKLSVPRVTSVKAINHFISSHPNEFGVHNGLRFAVLWCQCPNAYFLTVQHIVYCFWLASTRLRDCSKLFSQCHMSDYITITTRTVWHVVQDEMNKVTITTPLAPCIAMSMCTLIHTSDVAAVTSMSPIKIAAFTFKISILWSR